MTGDGDGPADAGGGRPTLRVVAGDATPEEIAAVVAAVAASTAMSAAAEPARGSPATSIWAAPASAHRQIRATFTPGPNAWRTSFWPR
ncbi:MAG TPA: acyl-CoA carboxylase epsilon subunit [Kineosporiaceae bacterium]|nr:acyl-CoA carboxylase epsilon subunit [Kineosporiaceae bacterium]